MDEITVMRPGMILRDPAVERMLAGVYPTPAPVAPCPSIPLEAVKRLRAWATGPWWQRQALESINRGWFTAIPGRSGSGLYLLRMWLAQPRMAPERDSWSSEQSVLLHWFCSADDDGSLHDHPWDFTTTILQGGYSEALPGEDWRLCMGGPQINERLMQHYAGASIVHRAEDLHAVATVCDDTWTLVRTGPERRPWGFHPPGKAWVPWRDFLAEARTPRMAVEEVAATLAEGDASRVTGPTP